MIFILVVVVMVVIVIVVMIVIVAMVVILAALIVERCFGRTAASTAAAGENWSRGAADHLAF
jgi:hypothetical protein